MRKEINHLVLKVILNNIPGTMRAWSRDTTIGTATFSGWMNGKHTPREDSLEIFVEYVCKVLSASEKEKLYQEIIKKVNINIKGKKAYTLQDMAREDFYGFLIYMLKDYNIRKNDSIDFTDIQSEKISEILKLKLSRWFLGENWISIGHEKIGNESCFRIEIKEKEIYEIILKYSFEYHSIEDVITSIQEHKCHKNMCYIIFVFFKIEDNDFLKILKENKVYLRQIVEEDMREQRINDCFVNVKGIEDTVTLQKLNLISDIIYNKVLDDLYLIYKEILCSRFNIDCVDDSFFYQDMWDILCIFTICDLLV